MGPLSAGFEMRTGREIVEGWLRGRAIDWIASPAEVKRLLQDFADNARCEVEAATFDRMSDAANRRSRPPKAEHLPLLKRVYALMDRGMDANQAASRVAHSMQPGNSDDLRRVLARRAQKTRTLANVRTNSRANHRAFDGDS